MTKNNIFLLNFLNLPEPPFFISIVYTKCDKNMRMSLCNDLRNISHVINGTWCVVGDFNTITSSGEKVGGMSYRTEDGLDFLMCLLDCGLQDVGFLGLSSLGVTMRPS